MKHAKLRGPGISPWQNFDTRYQEIKFGDTYVRADLNEHHVIFTMIDNIAVFLTCLLDQII